MSIIDIRKEEQEPVSVIIFAEGDENKSAAVEIENHGICYSVSINSSGEANAGRRGDGKYLFIDSKEDALNLIKALEKAIELGWLGN